jgi:hypothetical protein
MADARVAPFRLPALLFAVYLLVIAGSAAALFAMKLGASAARVAEHYLGSDAGFTGPRTLAGLLEVAVPHLAAVPLVLFAVAHVVGFARALPARRQRALVALSFGAALAGIAASFGVRFVSPSIAWVKVGAFFALEASLLAWAALLVSLFVPSPIPSRARRTATEEVVS